MKYYKDNEKNIYAYESDGSQDDLIGDKVAMTAEEVELHINPPKSEAEQLEELKQHFKSLYLQVFNAKLKELDYDGMDTLSMWANKAGSAFEVEAQSILNWYESIITYNYALLNAGSIPTDESYLAGMPVL